MGYEIFFLIFKRGAGYFLLRYFLVLLLKVGVLSWELSGSKMGWRRGARSFDLLKSGVDVLLTLVARMAPVGKDPTETKSWYGPKARTFGTISFI